MRNQLLILLQLSIFEVAMQKQQKYDLSYLYHTKSVCQLITHQIQQIPLQFNPQLSKYHNQIHIKVSYPRISQNYHFQITSSQTIDFFIIIGCGFPIYQPRLHLITQITQPAINDTRDFLSQILPHWSIRTSLLQIVQQIPKFLSKLQHLKQQIKLQKIGKLDLGKQYHLSLLKCLGGEWFIAFQLQELVVKMYIIYQTDTHFLLFLTKEQPTYIFQRIKMPKQQDITTLTLIFVAQIQSLALISIIREPQLEFILVFRSVKTRNLVLQNVEVTKRMKIGKGFSMVEKILKNIRRYQPIQLQLETSHDKNSEEQKILQEITKKQKQLLYYLNQSTIEQLNKAYQSAVEYYSVSTKPYYQIFLSKISNLYCRKDIKLILGLK